MAFINLGWKKKSEPATTQASPVVDNSLPPLPTVSVGSISENQDNSLGTNASIKTVVIGNVAPQVADNGLVDEHAESKVVPTSLPEQDVSVDLEGIKEIKGPPLPGESSFMNDEVKGSIEVTSEPNTVTTNDQVDPMSSVKMDTPVSPIPIADDKGTDQIVQPTPLDQVNIPNLDSPVTEKPELNDLSTNGVLEQEKSVDVLPPLNNVENDVVLTELKQSDMSTTNESQQAEIIVKASSPKTSILEDFFNLVLDKNASDLHFGVGYPPFLRVDGSLQPIGSEVLTQQDAERILMPIINEEQKKTLMNDRELDFSYEFKDDARFRINLYFEKGHLAGAFRYIPTSIRTIEDLKLPPILHEFLNIPHGFILVTGPTGSGKSTTLSSMIQEINSKQKKHIITIEDPIEYIYPKGQSLIDQREIHKDSLNWNNALRAVLRQDPNVVLIGEMRDFETIASAITVAETGHMVFATLHTNTAVQTVDRIIDVFPEFQQSQVRSQLSNVITAVLAQRLIPIRSGGRRAVIEVLIGTNAVRNAIREGKTYQIDNIIQTSYDVGMTTLEKSLVDLIREGELSVEDAQKYTSKPEELLRLIKKV